MCGLAGICHLGGRMPSAFSESIVDQMVHTLSLRGPDGSTKVTRGETTLGFTRLSLVAPTNGDQPFALDSGELQLIVNGEIYNHRELERSIPDAQMRTQSDCEVLLHLYQRRGLRFLDGVRGMFALVLWDAARHKLIFARDPFGIKPLFFHQNQERIIFASEMKALFSDPACPRSIDWSRALGDQLTSSWPSAVSAPLISYFDGIEIVPAGAILEIDATTGAMRNHTYWRLPNFSSVESSLSDDEFIGQYGDLLRSSVEDCASADTEVGLFLSGGVDSSAVAAFAKHGPSPTPHTFSAVTLPTVLNGDAPAAQSVARSLDLPHHQVVIDPNRIPSPDEWRTLVWAVESPLCGPEQLYKNQLYMHARAARPALKAMLLGQASDEFNGGYSAMLSSTGGWEGFENALRQLALEADLSRRGEWRPYFEPGGLNFIRQAAVLTGSRDDYQRYIEWKYRDIQQYNVWHEDRTAALNGVEARVPFLDTRLVELVAQIPVERRSHLLWDKRILREAVRGLLPDAIRCREKVSFYHGAGAGYTHTLIRSMLVGNDSELVEQALGAKGATDYLDEHALRAMVQDTSPRTATRGVLEFAIRTINLGLLQSMLEQPPNLPSAYRPLHLPCLSVDVPPDERILAGLSSAPPEDSSGPMEWADGSVLDLNDGVEVLEVLARPGEVLVAVDGELAHVIERTEVEWQWLLRRLARGHVTRDAVEARKAEGADLGERVRELLAGGLAHLCTEQAPDVRSDTLREGATCQ